MAEIFGGLEACINKSADPDREVEEVLPCLAIIKRLEAMIDDVVDTLKVSCPSPPVPTMSHWVGVSMNEG